MRDAQMIEEAVLGCCMLWDRPWPPEVTEIEPEYFTDLRRGQIWEAIAALINAKSQVDEVTLTAQLVKWDVNGCAAYLCDLVEKTPTKESLVDWSRILINDALQRKARQAVKEALARCGGNASAEDIAAAVADATRHLKPSSSETVKPISASMVAVVNELEREHLDPNSARIATTGIATLDSKFAMKAGELTVIAGRPSMGKTALALNIARNCSKNLSAAVVIFSLEMGVVALTRRLLANESGFSVLSLPGKAANGELMRACETIHSLNLYIDDRPNLNPADVHTALSRINQPIRLVIFDYIQLARMDDGEKNHALRVGKITKGLKGISKAFSCHVIGLAQLNRGVEQRRPPVPQLSDLRDSGNIEEDADNALLLYRPAYYPENDAPQDLVEIIIAKQRNGETGFVRASWDGPTQTFRVR